MMMRQFRVLYREFLFSVVDRELLSTRGTGDASRLLLQLVALLVGLSVCFCAAAFVIGVQQTALGRLVAAWSIEHFLIATTMLVVGVFAVLGWDRMFPSQRDVLVLGPLPVRPLTMFMARTCAMATALGVAVVALHSAAGLIMPLAFNRMSPGRPIFAPPFSYDAATPPAAASELETVLRRDLSSVIRDGPLAAGAGGGVAVGIYQRGTRRVFGFGAARSDSIFQIGSTSKPFTGLLLAAMAQRGQVRLDQPVRELIPDAGLARPAGDEIALIDLATHRSGLPGIPATYRPKDPANPAADFDVAALYAYLRARGVSKRPAPPFIYSNLGMGLLGHALARAAGEDYATLLRRAVTEPLGMKDTAVSLPPERQQRFLRGLDDYRRPVRPWDFDVLAPAGGLRSSASDLLTWLEANLHPERVNDRVLAAAIAASHRVRDRIDSDSDIALAWMFHPVSGEYEHAGGILGFTADAFFNPQMDLAVVVLSNIGPYAAWSAGSIGEHVRARLGGKPAVTLSEIEVPATGGVTSWLQLLAAYWVTMAAAGLFVFGLAASAQGLAAAVLPRRSFVRVSSWLQLAMFCAVIGTYFLQPMAARPEALLAAQSGGLVAWSPSFWFLGLFQSLSGSAALAPLARNAWIGLGVVFIATASAYALSYLRVLQQVAEQPDAAAPLRRWRWLPRAGSGPQTAVVHFGVRTVLRSAQHRVIMAFYWGIGFALTVFVLKVPRGQQLDEGPISTAWDEAGVPLVFASIVTMAFAVLAARLTFAMPRELEANWIFRVIPVRAAAEYMSARRRATVLASVVPVWSAWAVAFAWQWPWQPALGHLLVLGGIGMILVELALLGAQKIPCTCAYLPGKSQVHLVFVVLILLFVGLVRRGAQLEIEALQSPVRSAVLLGALAAAWTAVRVFNAAKTGEPVYDEELPDEAVTLGVWDSRAAVRPDA